MRMSVPSPRKTYEVNFPKLTGGLNLWELDYRLGTDESPDMKNLWWQNGVLQCRDGQTYISDNTTLGTGYTTSGTPFWGYVFFHIGTKLYYADPTAGVFSLTQLQAGVPEDRGSFVRYSDYLLYKNRGGFYKISYHPGQTPLFTCDDVTQNAYVPIIQINTDPTTHAGNLYQPENRLSPKKTVWYNANGGTDYYLPVTGATLVQVIVDGAVTTAYTYNASTGKIVFNVAPPITNPATNNTVRITYSLANTDALNSVLSCRYAITAGPDSLCILLGGCEAQPNAVFWNSNDDLSMNLSYWPMTFYNLVDDTEDPVTGFGKQYSDLIVFKGHALGKMKYGTQTIDDPSTNVDRVSISFTYESINTKTGCDLPWTIQLIENNLVFCNTYQGVHMLRSSSAAYENNVEQLSKKVNGSGNDRGLFRDVRADTVVTSFDDDFRYWVIANGHVYAWDYSLSTYTDPSWFYFDAINAVDMFTDDYHNLFHLDGRGRVTQFVRNFRDYGGAIDKKYRFPVQYFGSYDRLKDVTSALFEVRSDTYTLLTLTYESDYEVREDLTEISTRGFPLFPRDLTSLTLGPFPFAEAKYAKVARRKPGCKHVRHFGMTLRNNTPGADLAIVSAQLFYCFTGKER